jgi:hypothetical protein
MKKKKKTDEIRLTLPLPLELQDALISTQRQIAANGKRKSERVTVNSLMRAYLAAMVQVEVDTTNVIDEASLMAAAKKALFKA